MAASARPAVRPVRSGRRHERRLLGAFAAIDVFPCLQTSRDRVIRALDVSPVDRTTAVAVVESDVALTMRVLREARPSAGRTGTPAVTVPEAVEALGPDVLRRVVAATPTVDFFTRSGGWGAEPFAYRRHVTAVQAALQRIARRIPLASIDRLMAGAALHDVGKLVLGHAHAGCVDRPLSDAGTPEQRLAVERRATGIDHALVGGVLVRRWGLPASLARLVEQHHVDPPPRDGEEPAVLRLADMLARYGSGDPVSPPTMGTLAQRLGIERAELRELLFEQDTPTAGTQRDAAPSPLSARETEVLRHLAEGLVYKQIAGRLDLATSTVRTHLHNVYLKLGAVDRAQAVLIAVRSGWI